MTIKQKFERIDQSKLEPKQVDALKIVLDFTENFKTKDKDKIKITNEKLDNIIVKLQEKNPDAVKPIPSPKTSAKTPTKKVVKPKTPKRNIFSVAKEIKKEGETFEEAKKRASMLIKQEKEEANKTIKTEMQSLLKYIKLHKELQGISGTDLGRDAKRLAKVGGRRISKDGNIYYENRENRKDRLAPNYPKNAPLLENGGGLNKVMWQDVEIGDSARVKETNMMGLIIKNYGRKFHLRFPNGTEKTFDASDLEFFKLEKDEYEMAMGGSTEKYKVGQKFYDTRYDRVCEIVPSRYDGLVTWKRYNKSGTEFENDTQHSLVENQFDYLVNMGAYQISKQSMANGGTFAPNVSDGTQFMSGVYADGGDIDSKNITMAKRLKVKKWYLKTYPTDDLGEEINPDIDFWLLWKYMSQGYNFYNVLGVGDSVIRERVFEKLSEILGIDYDVIYQKWLNSDNYAKGGIIVTKIKDIPNLKDKVEKGQVTYRGLGAGKLADDFYKLAGQNGTRIKVDGQEYFITDDDFRELDWDFKNEKWMNKVKFNASARKYANGGEFMTDPTFGNFQNQVYAKGGKLTKSEVIRNMYKPSGDYFFEQKGNDLIVHLTSRDAGNSIVNLSDKYDVKDNGMGYYGVSYILSRKNKFAKGGLLKPMERYVLEIKGLTGLRVTAIESYIEDNNLSSDDVLNIVIGLGRKQLKGSNVATAVVGKKGNSESKKLIAFAKNNEGMKMANGGDLENFSDNQLMIINQNIELERHHEELEDILEDKTDVPAWVVAKIATATESISDVTHYLDGEKELLEDEKEEGEEKEESKEEDEDDVIVEPISVSSASKSNSVKDFSEDALGNLKGFLKGKEGIELEEDYTFSYKGKKFEIEPMMNSDEKGISNALFTVYNDNNEEVGEIIYTREGGKQKFRANSIFFKWNNTKFANGGTFAPNVSDGTQFMSGVYAEGGDVQGKDTWQNIFEEFGFKKGRSKYGLDIYSKRGYSATVDNKQRNVELMFDNDVLYSGFSIQGLLDVLQSQFGKRNFANGGGIRSQSELKKIFLEKQNLVKNLTPKQIAEMWNKNSYGVKEGISKPMTIEEAKNPTMRMYLENLLIENELTEDEQSKYFANGGAFAPNVSDGTQFMSGVYANGGTVSDAPFSVEVFKTKLRFDNELTSSSKGDFPTFAKAKEFAIDMIDNGNYYAYIVSKNGYLWGVSSNGVEQFANGGEFMTDPNFGNFQNQVYARGGGVGKTYYHILEYGDYGNIGYQGYYDTIEEAQKQVEKLSNYFPNQTFQIFADKSKKEPPITTMARGGYVSKGELVWRKLSNLDRSNFLYENFTPEITPMSQELLIRKDFNFLPKKVKIKMEAKYANVEDYAKGGKFKKYIDHDDIESVTLDINTNYVTFSGKDVLNGANIMEDGGDLSKIATYFSVKKVVKVELKNGETVNPVNGYWLKKGAKPYSKPSGTSASKIDETKAHFKIENGEVFVDSNFVNQSQNNLPNSELKHYGFGEFYLETPDGQIDFARKEDKTDGFVGRTHKLRGDNELILKLIKSMSEKGRFDSGQKLPKFQEEPKQVASASISSGSDLTKLKKGDIVLLKDGSSTREATVTEDGLDSQKRVRVRPNGFPFDISVTLEENNKTYVIKKLMMGGSYANGGELKDFEQKVKDALKVENKWHYISENLEGKQVDLKMFVGKKEVDVQIFKINGMYARMPKNYVGKRETLKMIMDNFEGNYELGGDLKGFSDNQRMIMNQNVQLEHHHEELKDILEDKTDVPAWVVAKMATANESISEVTYYLDKENDILEVENEENDEDEDEVTVEPMSVEPMTVSNVSKADIIKDFSEDALGNLKGFLKGKEGIELEEDYTFSYKGKNFEIEPVINTDEKGVSNALFTVYNDDEEQVGEVVYTRGGGKQNFIANSKFFKWNNTKFAEGGMVDSFIPNVGTIDTFMLKSMLIKNPKVKSTLGVKEFEFLKNKDTDCIGVSSKPYNVIVTDGNKEFELDMKKWTLVKPLSQARDKIKSHYSENYAKGGEIAKAEILGLKRNIMGTTDIEMKITGMRKPQSFIVYPISKDDSGEIITIQSETRIGKIDLSTGRGLMSQSHSNGAYFVHFQMDKKTPFVLSDNDLKDLKEHINKTSGASVGTRGIVTDNSGASKVFANGGNKFELGGVMVSDLAGHTSGSLGTGDPTLLSDYSGTYYGGLTGETGAMSAGEMFARGGGVGDNVLGLKKGDIYKIIDTQHTASSEVFTFIDYVDKDNHIMLKSLTFPPNPKKKNDFVYVYDISSDGVKVLNDEEIGQVITRKYKNFVQKNYEAGGTLTDPTFLNAYSGTRYTGLVAETGALSSGELFEMGGGLPAGAEQRYVDYYLNPSPILAEGGSLEAHGIEEGDTFIKTISGNIQKVKDKNGNIVFINLSTGERDSQPPLPFKKGGSVDYKYLNHSQDYEVIYGEGKNGHGYGNVEYAQGGTIEDFKIGDFVKRTIKEGSITYGTQGFIYEIDKLFSEIYLEDEYGNKNQKPYKIKGFRKLKSKSKYAQGANVEFSEKRKEYLQNLGNLEAEVWDKIGAFSGGQIRKDKTLLKEYALGVSKIMETYGIGYGSFDQQDYDFYTDENWHLFNEFLVWNNYYEPEMTKVEKAWRKEAFEKDPKHNYISNPEVITLNSTKRTNEQEASSSSFKPTVEFNVGDVVWQKSEKMYGVVMDNYGNKKEGSSGDIRLDSTGNTNIFEYDKNYENTGYNLVKFGSSEDAGDGNVQDIKDSANRLIKSQIEYKDKEKEKYYREIFKRVLAGEFDKKTKPTNEQEVSFSIFEKIINESKSEEDAFNKAREVKGIPLDVSKYFMEKYDPNRELTPRQSFSKFYKEVKGNTLSSKSNLNRHGFNVKIEEVSATENGKNKLLYGANIFFKDDLVRFFPAVSGDRKKIEDSIESWFKSLKSWEKNNPQSRKSGDFVVFYNQRGDEAKMTFDNKKDAYDFYDALKKVEADNIIVSEAPIAKYIPNLTKKYIPHYEIKSVTVKKGGKEVTYDAKDVLNGANMLKSGGEIDKEATYISKTNVVHVELKDGTQVKPSNGYWVKKGAIPIDKMEDGGKVEEWKKATTIAIKTKQEAEKSKKLLEEYWGKSGRNFKVEKRGDGYVVLYEFYLTDKMEDGGKVEEVVINKDGIKVKSVAQPKKKLTEAEWLAKYSESKEARSYKAGGDLSKYSQFIQDEFPASKRLANKFAKKYNLPFLVLVEKGNDDAIYLKEANGFYAFPKSYIDAHDVLYVTNDRLPTSKEMAQGGKVTFKEKSKAIAKKFVGKRVEPKYQKEYGKVYSKEEAGEVGNKIAGKMVAGEKMKKGGIANRGGIMLLAKQIRNEGESWKDALKRAGDELKK